MKIKDLPDSSKPRERFLKHGKEALSDAELMALILRTGTTGENVVEMCNRLIKEHGLENLFDCSLKELQEIKGIGKAKAIQLLAMSELGKRYSQEKNSITKITQAKDVYDYFKDKLKNEKQENFYVLILNTKNQIIKEEFITRGVLDASIIHPREIFRPAIKNSAAKIILVHNHPSGNPKPSNEDIEITKKLIDSGEMIDIKVVDHVIIGNKENHKKGFWSWVEDERCL
jgi:DNA repair protein RadC